jgi:FAD/FMN-containing dehydrogenase
VVAAEVVTADGAVRRIDRDHDADLFWALRGGGGAFAAVLSLDIQLVPLRTVYAGSMLWPMERAAEVLHAWRVWTHDAPDTVTSIARLLRYPPLPDLPEQLRGRRFVAVEAAFLEEADRPDIWLRPFRALKPEIDSFIVSAAPDLGQLHGDPAQPVPALSDHRLLRELPSDAVDALLACAGEAADLPLLAVDLRHLGAAMGTGAAHHGVLDRIDATYALFAVGLPVTPELGAAIPPALDRLRDALAGWSADTSYLNFADRPVDPARLFGPDTFARLQAVKAAYDPRQLLVSNHPIPLPD